MPKCLQQNKRWGDVAHIWLLLVNVISNKLLRLDQSWISEFVSRDTMVVHNFVKFSQFPAFSWWRVNNKNWEQRKKTRRDKREAKEHLCYFSKKAFPPTLTSNTNPEFASCGSHLSIKTVVDFPGKMILHCQRGTASFISPRCLTMSANPTFYRWIASPPFFVFHCKGRGNLCNLKRERGSKLQTTKTDFHLVWGWQFCTSLSFFFKLLKFPLNL